MPVTVNGLIPTVKVASCICTDPSSTRFPVGSKTDKSFAPSVNSALAIIVTAVGATLNTDPATGDELTKDVANAASFLLDKRTGFVTGQVLYVCGGLTISSAPL